MRRLLFIGLALVLIAVALFVVGLVAVLLVVFAYGLGGLLTRFLPLEIGQATLLSLIAIVAATFLAGLFLSGIAPTTALNSARDDEDELDAEDDWEAGEFDEDELEEEEAAPVVFIPSVPRWRQPLKTTRYEGTDRNAPCPCGSGRKYKNCHGRPNST